VQQHFETFRRGIIGIDQELPTPYGRKPLVYADWTASGRNYGPIEDCLRNRLLPYVANTHTETSGTGQAMTYAYHRAKEIIKQHVNAGPKDVIICAHSGMTGVVNKWQRILGLRVHEKYRSQVELPEDERPIVFVTHMEHHSNQTSWLETIADVAIIEPNEDGLVSLEHLDELLERYRNRPLKIAAVTSCSNVTGIFTPYHAIAQRMHAAGGYCFVDFACSAPYIDIDMHPEEEGAHLDAIYFSPHKFLGGPGSSGVLIFNSELYHNRVPDHPGGGTVDWTNPWGGHKYTNNIEAREDGGTPGFLQTIRTAKSIQLKEAMGTDRILAREKEQLAILWERFDRIPNLRILAGEHRERLGVISCYITGLHFNLGVKLLNDRYGIQVRGGCSCAGTYGHYLLKVQPDYSHHITCMIDQGDLSEKPGWMRLSIHPTMTDEEIHYIADAMEALAANFEAWSVDYEFDASRGEYIFKDRERDSAMIRYVEDCFSEQALLPKEPHPLTEIG
jgi:selenocysteine lyase/cysteine desulfurase